MTVSERGSTPGVVLVANTQDEGRQQEFHVPQRACLTAPGQISQQLLRRMKPSKEKKLEKKGRGSKTNSKTRTAPIEDGGMQGQDNSTNSNSHTQSDTTSS